MQGERAPVADSPGAFRQDRSSVRQRIFLEHGYGEHFGTADGALAELVGGINTCEHLIASCDIVLLPKVQTEDLAEMKKVGQVIWGWSHCVRDAASRRWP